MSAPLTSVEDWISAAIAEVTARGLEGLRIERLANTLGVSRIGFYQRFPNRQGLIDAVVDRWSLDVEQMYEKAQHIEDPIEQIRSVGYEVLTNRELRALDRVLLLSPNNDVAQGYRMRIARGQTVDWASRLLRRRGFTATQARRRAELLFVGLLGLVAEVEAVGGAETDRQLRARIDRLVDLAAASG